METCLLNCTACVSACEKTIAYCLQKGGAHVAPAHMSLLLDCADICKTSAAFLARGSELHVKTCEVCAEVCQRCADSCSEMGDDAQMKACAAACLACVASCNACCY
ncbi:MAG: four-helix bundle copper-binding protein [Deltaproteobacteria bacterium]|nr:four-helix bundle copper-binding protein [Deltaproteobacteria bacterium]